jgi:hypothetical protein
MREGDAMRWPPITMAPRDLGLGQPGAAGLARACAAKARLSTSAFRAWWAF